MIFGHLLWNCRTWNGHSHGQTEECPGPLKLCHILLEFWHLFGRDWNREEALFGRRYTKPLRQIEPELAAASDVQSACRKVGVSEATYYNWRKRYCGMTGS